MAVELDFTLARREDGTLAINMTPPTNIAGWSLQFTQRRRFQSISGNVSGLIVKSAASGYGGGVSGITITSSGEGRFTVALFRTDLSGDWDPGTYSYDVQRMDSGSQTVLVHGFRLQ